MNVSAVTINIWLSLLLKMAKLGKLVPPIPFVLNGRVSLLSRPFIFIKAPQNDFKILPLYQTQYLERFLCRLGLFLTPLILTKNNT